MRHSLGKCPECGAGTRVVRNDLSLVVSCQRCAWMAVSTNDRTPPFDSQRYSAFVASDLPARDLAVRLAVSLGERAVDMLDVAAGKKSIAQGIRACEVLHLAGLLAPRGIAVRTEPTFPWVMPNGSSAG